MLLYLFRVQKGPRSFARKAAYAELGAKSTAPLPQPRELRRHRSQMGNEKSASGGGAEGLFERINASLSDRRF